MSTLRVSNIEAKADPSSPSVDEKLKVTNSNGDVLIHIDGKTAGITTVGINTTDKSFTVDAAQNVEFSGIVTATKFSLSGGGEITGGDGNFTGIVTAGSIDATSATFSGNVSIGGTLTYEDVTSIDSIGIVTAQSDVHVGAGLSVVGISTLANTNVNGQLTVSNSNVTGVSTLGNTIIGTGTTELIVTGNARVTGSLTATNFSGNLTGNVTGNVTGESTLSGISSSISDTAVDVFVYDTSKDSDGGAWRKRTTHTSWYNETLGTATRGSRKEFPAVAVIVAESTQVTIYDGDDPDLPMWMVFTQTGDAGNVATQLANSVNATVSSVYMLNGILCVGFDSTSQWGVSQIKFTSDSQEFRWTSGIYILPSANNIAKRNVSSGWIAYDTTTTNIGYGNAIVNDVAMTVLPNAPIDSATGLPVPIIAVGTVGGTSVIKEDKTIIDLTGFSPITTVHIDADNVIGTSNSGTPTHDFIFKTHIPPSDEAYNGGITAGSKNYYMNSNSGTIPLLRDLDMSDSTYDSKDDVVYRGGNAGFDIIRAGVNYSQTHSNPSIAYISKDYNTGYMVGNIKGAFLSDTDIEDGVELVSNGTFNTNTTGWTVVGGASATVSSGQVQLTNNGTTNSSLDQTVTTVVGKTYEISATITPQGGGPLPRLYVGNKYVQVGSNSNSAQTVTLTFLAYSTSTIVSINTNTNVNNAVTLADNVSMKLTNDVTGTDLNTDPNFDSGVGIFLAATGTVTHSSGTITSTKNSGGTSAMTSSAVLTVGKSYYIEFQITAMSAGYVHINSPIGEITSGQIGTHSGTFTATGTTVNFGQNNGGSTSSVTYTRISVTPAEEDRSVNNKGLAVYGTVTKSAVATGTELVAYSGFSASNYLQQPNNTDYSFGTGDFYVMTWVYPLGTSAAYDFMLELNDASTSTRFYLIRNTSGRVYVPWNTDVAGSELPLNQWSCVVAQRSSGTGEIYVNGEFIMGNAWTSANNLTQTGGTFIGIYPGNGVGPNNLQYPLDGKLSLMRIGAGAISAEQIKKIYDDERWLFQENAKCTLYGSSDAVTALAYDEVTDQLHVGTSSGRSDFQGLRRINNTTTAVTTAISAHDEFIIEQ